MEPDKTPGQQVKEILLMVAAMVIGLTIAFLALVGLVFLAVPHTPSDTTTCDEVRQIDNQWWCLGSMSTPSDKISITRQ